MKLLATVLSLLLGATMIYAQQTSPPIMAPVPHQEVLPAGTFGDLGSTYSTESMVSKSLFYFEGAMYVGVRQFPMNLGGGNYIYWVSERFTSPSPVTYLDSVRVFFPTVAVGDVKVVAFRDTLLQISTGDFYHFANISTEYGVLDTFRILRENIVSKENYTAKMTGVSLPGEFHVLFQPIDRGDVLPAFTLALSMDSIPKSTIGPENARMTFVFVSSSGTGSGVYYENSPNPDYAYYTNIVMSVSVTYDDAASVVGDIASPAGMAIQGLYPQPVSQSRDGGATVALSLDKGQDVSIAVYDVMGRKARDIVQANLPPGDQLLNIPTTGLAPGSYVLRVQGRRGMVNKPFIVTQ